MTGKLGEILLEEKLITSDQLREALEHQRANGGQLGNSLVRLGFLSDDGVVAVLSGTRTLKHKKSGISKTYEMYGKPPTWFSQIEEDFKSDLFKKT